jgi:hypothetical protein
MVDEEEKVVGDRKFECIYTFSSGGRGSVVSCKRESNVSNNAIVNNRAIVNNNVTVNNNAIIRKSRRLGRFKEVSIF